MIGGIARDTAQSPTFRCSAGGKQRGGHPIIDREPQFQRNLVRRLRIRRYLK